MAEILKNTGAKLWSMVDDHDELQTNVFDQLFGTGGKSDIRLIDEAIGKINESLNGYYFKIINDKLYICKDTGSGTTSIPLSITDDNGHTALKVDGTSITIDGNGVVHGATIDDAFSLTSENAVQNKVVKAKFDEIEEKVNANETTISSHTTVLATLNGEGEGSVKKTVTDEIAKVVSDAPESLDTLKEISDWISSHESDASAMNSDIQTNKSDIATLQTDKVDKEIGKSLLADTDKTNYDDAASKAHTHDNKSVLDGITSNKVTAWDTVNNKVDKVDGKGLSTEDYTTSEKTIVSKLGESEEGSLTYNGSEIKPSVATTESTGVVKPDGTTITIDEDGTLHGAKVTVDDAMSDTSTNAVQNKVIKSYVDGTFKQKMLAQMPGDGKTSYCQLCTIKISNNWVDTPIEITVQERGRATLDRLTVLFAPFDNSDPDLLSFKIFGEFGKWYISKTAASTWVIYGEKSTTWAHLRVVDYVGYDGVNVTWDVTGVTSLPDSKIKAEWGGNVGHAVSADRASSALTVTNADAAMSDTSTNAVQNKVIKSYVDNGLNTLKKSVSDGKTKVANAITDKGVETATDATFDVMAENISKIETGGGELHGATLAVSTTDSELFGQTVTLTLNGANVGTTVFADNGTCSFVVQNPGTYTITCGEAHKDVTVTGDNVVNKTVISVELSLLKIVAFATGTDAEIAAMIEAHYNNKINIADYWAVGDMRTVHLSAMAATGVGESHRAQDVQFVIGDFEHDDLATPINGHSKAAVTLLQKDCLMDASNASNPVNGEHNTENGYMNSTNTNVGGWKSCARRTWCNNVFFAALPSVWQSMVKTVNKKVSVGNNSSTIETVQDKIFLAAEIEIFGSTTHSFSGEGTQYQYYKNATANRYKMPKWSWSSGDFSNIYWERSPCIGDIAYFCTVYIDGNIGGDYAYNDRGVAPCLCI